MSTNSINTDLIFNNNQDLDNFISNKYPHLANDILYNCAKACYIENQTELENLINNNATEQVHLLKMDSTLQKFYENGLSQNTLRSNNHIFSSIHYYDSFINEYTMRSNGGMPSADSYQDQIQNSLYYIISKTSYNTNISLFSKKYRNSQLIDTASEIMFFNRKIDIGRALLSISYSGLNNTNNNIIVSTPWLYKVKKGGIRRYTLEINSDRGTFDMYEYNVFRKRTSSAYLGSFKESNQDFAISSFVNRVNKINMGSSSENVSYEIYNYETMHKFCEISQFDINDIPDFLSEGKMFYYRKEENILIERNEYIKRKNVELKKTIKSEKKKKIKQQLEKMKQENNVDGKLEAIGFLESLLSD
jgi:hypothetical protein